MNNEILKNENFDKFYNLDLIYLQFSKSVQFEILIDILKDKSLNYENTKKIFDYFSSKSKFSIFSRFDLWLHKSIYLDDKLNKQKNAN